MIKDVLSKNILKHYDSNKVYNRVKEVYELFDYLESSFNDFEYPIVSSLGRIRYEQFVEGTNNSKVENFVLRKMMIELRDDDYKRRLFSSKVALALKKLSKIELTVFKYSIYDEYDIVRISELINYGETKTKDIKKSACVRFLLALNIDKDCIKGGDAKLVNDYFNVKSSCIRM